MSDQWYVLRSKPHSEDAAYRQVQSHGITAYYPCMKVRTVNPRARQLRPYYPGYLFVKVDIASAGLSVFQYMPYSSGLVSFEGIPAPVPDTVMAGIQKTVDEITQAGRMWYDELQHGDTVLIHSGPLRSYQAMFHSRVSGTDRVRLLLEMVRGNTVTVTLDAAYIESTKRR
jgi:transcription antitermination factor NusG